jgi:hypothetical protein
MAWALLFPDTEKRGRGNKRTKDLPSKSFSAARLSQARTVLDYSEPLALEVRDGGRTLNEAYEKVKEEKQRGNSDDAKRADQRAHVRWWDKKVRDAHRPGGELTSAQERELISQADAEQDTGIDIRVVSRWRNGLAHESAPSTATRRPAASRWRRSGARPAGR